MCNHPHVEQPEFLKAPIEACYTRAKPNKIKGQRENGPAAQTVVDEPAPALSVPDREGCSTAQQ